MLLGEDACASGSCFGNTLARKSRESRPEGSGRQRVATFLVGLLKKEKTPFVLAALNEAIAVFDQNLSQTRCSTQRSRAEK